MLTPWWSASRPPTTDHVVFAHSGSYSYQITSKGQACHSSHPTDGINAVMGLVHFINEETRLFDDVAADPVLGTLGHSVTVINGRRQVKRDSGLGNPGGQCAPDGSL